VVSTKPGRHPQCVCRADSAAALRLASVVWMPWALRLSRLPKIQPNASRIAVGRRSDHDSATAPVAAGVNSYSQSAIGTGPKCPEGEPAAGLRLEHLALSEPADRPDPVVADETGAPASSFWDNSNPVC
jgi:hypothetical protein